ncbi:MAG TPA: hypothetical protein VK850_16520 [Candidatus Binatia bacterium]|nr:hypothetical protein [Candidatus Binatia bacterium]
MIGDIRKHLEITPFVPFSVHLADGREYPVPTIDHIICGQPAREWSSPTIRASWLCCLRC